MGAWRSNGRGKPVATGPVGTALPIQARVAAGLDSRPCLCAVRNLMGREEVLVHELRRTVRREIGGIGRSPIFHLTQVRDLRASPATYSPTSFSSGLAFWGLTGGNVPFDYGASTHRFGSGIDEAEARQIVRTIKQRVRILEDADTRQ